MVLCSATLLTQQIHIRHIILLQFQIPNSLELAIAGFKKDEVTIQEDNGVLTITADKQESSTAAQTYQYRGIAKRSFSKSFRIAEHFEISKATMADGILTICFVKNTPVATPKFIAIN